MQHRASTEGILDPNPYPALRNIEQLQPEFLRQGWFASFQVGLKKEADEPRDRFKSVPHRMHLRPPRFSPASRYDGESVSDARESCDPPAVTALCCEFVGRRGKDLGRKSSL